MTQNYDVLYAWTSSGVEVITPFCSGSCLSSSLGISETSTAKQIPRYELSPFLCFTYGIQSFNHLMGKTRFPSMLNNQANNIVAFTEYVSVIQNVLAGIEE